MVQVHGGECSTTHVHIENNLKNEPNASHCARVGRRLTDCVDETCGEGST